MHIHGNSAGVRQMNFGSFDGREDGEHSGVDMVETSDISFFGIDLFT